MTPDLHDALNNPTALILRDGVPAMADAFAVFLNQAVPVEREQLIGVGRH